MSDLASLLERVKAAKGPDRVLDADIYRAVSGIGAGASVGWAVVPKFSLSIDAALALVERLLPNTCVLVGDYKGVANPTFWGGKIQYAKGFASLSIDDDAMSSFRAHAETPPLAILAALLSSLTQEPIHDRP